MRPSLYIAPFFISLVVLVLFSNLKATAQVSDPGSARSGSVYSFFGAGQPLDIGLVEEESMGIFGISYRGVGSSGFGNPAFFAQTFYTSATVAISAERFSAADNQSTSVNRLINPSSVLINYPLLGGKLGLATGLYPVTRYRFRIFQDGSVQNGPDDPIAFSVNDQGAGGINKFEVGLGLKVVDNLYVGWAPSFVFVSSQLETLFETNDFSIGQQFTQFNIDGQGFGNRFGVALNIPQLTNEDDVLTLAATLNLPVRINANRTKEFDKFLGNDFATVVINQGPGLGSGDIDLPLELGGGLTYYPGIYTNFSVETQFQQWSRASYDFSSNEEALLKDRFRLGMGGQFHPYRTGSNKLFSKFKYSFGASYDNGHLSINGENIETLLFSAGFGILSSRSRSTLDFSIQYGVRGTRKNNLVKEDILGFRLSVNLTELMFIRPKLQ
jgi:hypothetical protein